MLYSSSQKSGKEKYNVSDFASGHSFVSVELSVSLMQFTNLLKMTGENWNV